MKNFTKVALATVMGALMAVSSVANAKTTFRFGYETPRTDSQHIAAQEFKKMVEEATDGEIVIKLFPDSTLGGAPALINGVRNGTVDMIVLGSNNLSGLSQELSVIDLPFLFKDRASAYKVLDGSVGDYLRSTLEPVGIKGLAFWDNGFRQITNNKHPINTPDDLKGLKMRVPNTNMAVKLFETLGSNPVPLSVGELYTALETRTVDGQDHPLGVVYSSKFYEVQKYLSLTNHQYSALLMCMNKKKFDKLTAEQQNIILDSAKKAGVFQRKLNEENQAKQIAEFQKAGVEVK